MKHDLGCEAESGGGDTSGISLDLTDESGLLVENWVGMDPSGVRSLLAALNLSNVHESEPAVDAPVFDLAIYRATGSAHLAELFCREFRPCR